MVLATDGKVSFAFFNFGTLQFGNSSNFGFRKSSVMNYMESEALSVATNVASLSNIGIICGIFLYRIDLHFILQANGCYGSISIRVSNCHIVSTIDSQLFIDFMRNSYTVNEASRLVEVCVFVDAIGDAEFSEPFSLLLETSTPSGAMTQQWVCSTIIIMRINGCTIHFCFSFRWE